MSATLVTAAAAGWYHDPSDSGSWRWWDGATWTSHVRPKVETTPIAVAAPVSEAISLPVAIQPAPAPQPVAVPVIPQPAQPIQTILPLSLTPETPASEQEYWHSAGAEVVHIPGRSATQHGSHFAGVGPGGHAPAPYDLDHTWGEVGSPQTPGIWLLAFLPIISIPLQFVVGFVLGFIQGASGVTVVSQNIAFWAVLLVLAWIFAGLDVRELRVRGYKAPVIWWMLLLPPFAYFIARGRVVRREGQRAWPPELLFFLTFMALVLSAVLVFVSVMSLLSGLLPTQLA